MLKDLKCPCCKNYRSCSVMGIGEDAIKRCGMFNPINPIRTNADRIRSMGNDGLAAWYCHDRDCRGCEFGASDGCHLLDWLKAPVEVQE